MHLAEAACLVGAIGLVMTGKGMVLTSTGVVEAGGQLGGQVHSQRHGMASQGVFPGIGSCYTEQF